MTENVEHVRYGRTPATKWKTCPECGAEITNFPRHWRYNCPENEA